jgi:hypothetical protein
MSNRWSLAGVAFALAALAGACCSPGTIGSLPVTLHPQETSMWCWAASGQMIMHYLGNNVAQCTQANNRFGRSDCPCSQCGSNPQTNPPCVTGGWPEFDKYGFTFQRTSDTALTFEQLRKELSPKSSCGKRPVAFSWHWSGGGGHMMVADGYVTVEGTQWVSILDPWAPCAGDARLITYAAYVSGAGYTHWDDFHQIRRQ